MADMEVEADDFIDVAQNDHHKDDETYKCRDERPRDVITVSWYLSANW